MSVSHCMHRALEIANLPVETWGDAIERVPDTCAHADCTEFKSCRARIREYLRMQYRMHSRRQRPKRGAR